MKNPKFYTPDTSDESKKCSEQEWDACLKVLDLISKGVEIPFDLQPLERLVSRLQKQIRKRNRRDSFQAKRTADHELLEETKRVHDARGNAANFDAVPLADKIGDDDFRGDAYATLNRPRRCYICQTEYRKLHSHYHRLCPSCAQFNYSKRVEENDFGGRTAIVTGGRTKIGYQTALRLLRGGARVIATTRFSHNAAQRYAMEPDFNQWNDRLEIHRLDFRNPLSVSDWADQLIQDRKQINILIHNAAQTVWRADSHYESLAQLEASSIQHLDPPVRRLLAPANSIESSALIESSTGRDLQKILTASPFEEPEDRREVTSWGLNLDEVDTVELLEVILINSTAPFILNGKLKTLLKQSAFTDRYIVHVSGKDGRFTVDDKTTGHPHVNMSKAAANMMTRTSAEDFAEDKIFMNSVDTGWVTLEGGFTKRKKREAEGFAPPLDEIDAAARIVAPVVDGMQGQPQFGKLFKDYEPADW